MFCAKCKQAPPQPEDTWCLACSGWEALSIELGSKWANPALRGLAEDAVVGCVRLVRGLRKLGEDLSSAAGSTRAVVGDIPVPCTSAKAAATRPPLPRIGPAAAKQEQVGSEEESEEELSEESSHGAAGEGVHRGETEVRDSGAHRDSEHISKYSRIGGAGRAPRAPSFPPPPPVRAEGSSHRGSRRHRDRSRGEEPRREKRRGHRGGRKHKRLYRAVSDPSIRVHRSVATGFWDQTPSRQGAGALERRR